MSPVQKQDYFDWFCDWCEKEGSGQGVIEKFNSFVDQVIRDGGNRSGDEGSTDSGQPTAE